MDALNYSTTCGKAALMHLTWLSSRQYSDLLVGIFGTLLNDIDKAVS
jgi:hypothetical protein